MGRLQRVACFALLASTSSAALAQQSVPVRVGAPAPTPSPVVAPAETQPRSRTAGEVSISLPLIVDGRPAPQVQVVIRGDVLIGVEAASLATALDGRASAAVRSQLQQRGGALISPAELTGLGLNAVLDMASLAILIDIAGGAREAQSVDFGFGDVLGAQQVAPASDFAIGVTGSYFRLQDVRGAQGSGNTISDLSFNGFANLGGKDGFYLLYSGTYRLGSRFGSQSRFERGRIVAFHDDQEKALRYSVGDLSPVTPRLVGGVDLAGIGLERRYQDIQPLRNVRPTGSRSFVVERPSRIDVYSNGALVRTLNVEPGQVDLRDIPALAQSSNVSIVIEDSFGRREFDSFTLTNDVDILSAGLSEFSFAAGFLRDSSLSNLRYTNDPVASGTYLRGLSDTLTAGGHFVVSEAYQNVGLDGAAALAGGVLVGSLSASRIGGRTGGAISIDYRGDPFGQLERNGQLNVHADLRTRNYRTLDLFGFGDQIKFDLSADYRIDLSDRFAVTAGGSYFKQYGGSRATYSLFGGVQTSFGRVFATATARYVRRSDGRTDVGGLFTLSVPIGRKHTFTASADTTNERGRFEFRRRRDLTVPEFDYSVSGTYGPSDSDLTGRTRYASSRFEVEGNVTQRFSDRQADRTIMGMRLQSGIAFADGSFAIGRDPGQGFAIVRKHESLNAAKIDVAGGGTARRVAQANGFGPGVVPQISPYRPDIIGVNLIGAEVGYDIGPGEYQTDPGAATGTVITVGRAAYRSALAVLVDRNGAPLGLKYGQVTGADGKSAPFFTNASGRAAFLDLAPGTYRATLDDEAYRFTFTVGNDQPAMVDLGTLSVEDK